MVTSPEAWCRVKSRIYMIFLMWSIKRLPVQEEGPAESTPEMLTVNVSGCFVFKFYFEIVLVLEKIYKNSRVHLSPEPNLPEFTSHRTYYSDGN